MADFDNTRSFQFKPDFDKCLARIYAWYEQRIIDRPPVRFLHHNIEYEKHRTVKGPWKTSEERWLDVHWSSRKENLWLAIRKCTRASIALQC